jgi:lipoate-protein ligase B
LWSPKELAQRGVELHWVDRGGDITYHGPGQLVGYPLLPLGQVDHRGRIPRADYVGHLRKMEAFLIRALATLGMASGRIPGLSGVWVQPHVASRCPRCPPPSRRRPSKIAALGVKVDVRGISRHGFALNVDTDPTYWEGLVPCGLHDHPVVSLSQLLDPCPSMEQVEEALLSELEQAYALQLNRSGQPL